MGILSWIAIGLAAGWLARFITRTGPENPLFTSLIGIAGAFVGGYIGSLLGFGTVTGFNVMSVVLATGGAAILLLLYRLIGK